MYISFRNRHILSPKVCIRIFIAVLSKVTKNWKQPKYSSVIEWVNELLYIHTIMHYRTQRGKKDLKLTR